MSQQSSVTNPGVTEPNSNGFDTVLFNSLQTAYRSGELSPERIRLQAEVLPPSPEQLLNPAQLSQVNQAEYTVLGNQAVARGEVAAVVLAGGMATRFDFDAPKGLFPIVGQVSFLELKVRALCGQGIAIYLMTSFHTHQATLDFLEAHDYFGHREKVFLFQQFRLPRISPSGEVRSTDTGLDFATCGHGDFVEALRQSGLLSQFLAQGGRWLLFSNIDNLGASFDPLLLGAHISSGVDMSIEVAAKVPGDKGGAPALVDGRLQLVEEFLFPADFDQDQIQVFNTASYIFTAAALDRDFDLPWYVVKKQVDSEPVLQFEHLAGDLSRELSEQVLLVDRAERFLPVKQLEDAPQAAPLIRRKYAELLGPA
ncbi:MAG: hypothetical protein CVV27_18040 [Candidatus Melainabacteria bacterium HGW-Melainabacteria-1]|nr:MAG: hypothetical protein CVV27_18040 [Candidatus Melainabacteria bacterium HGW-Melainabacteria-1]